MSQKGIVHSFSGSDDLLVLPPERFLGRSAFENPQPDVAEAFEPARWRVAKRGDPVRYRHSATSWRGLAEIHDSTLRRDGPYLVLVCRDLTAHYSMPLRRALATTLVTLKASFDEEAALCLTDEAGRVWWWPRGAERTTRIPFGWMLGRILVQGPPQEHETTVMTPYHQVTVGLHPVPLWQGLHGILWVLRDASRLSVHLPRLLL